MPTKAPASRTESAKTPRSTNNAPNKSTRSANYPLRGGPRCGTSGVTRVSPAEDGDVFMADDIRPNPQRALVRALDSSQAAPPNPIFTGEVAHVAQQMQEWEMAPGHIDIVDGDFLRSVVYSGPFLSSRQKIRVCDSVSLSMRTLGPSEVLHMHLEDGDADKDRLCSILSGHACVKVGDGEEIVVGKGGVVMARPDVAVRIQNRFYEPCSIQIMTIEM